jgi:alkylation response protein AidB-like acyl-CoA dehydrogenase
MTWSEEQSMLLDTATNFFRDKSMVADVRRQIETESGFDSAIWQEIVELGWTGLAIPEQFGGSGLGLAAAVSIAEPMGRRLFASPFQSTQLAIQALLAGSESQRAQWLGAFTEECIGTVALVERNGDWDLGACECSISIRGETALLTGTKTFVLDAQAADVFVVSARCDGAPAMAIVPSSCIPAAALTRQIVIDQTRRSYELQLDGIEVPAANLILGSSAGVALEAIRDAALLLNSAEACGGIAGALDLIVEYLNTRTQFGRRIGSYQALKHPSVDILVGLERSRSHLYHAASLIQAGRNAEVALRMAKAESSESFAFAGDRAVQFHGGFGFTYECDAQLYLRRAMWCQYNFGDAAHHRKRLAEMLL